MFLRLCVRAVREGGSHPDRFFCKGLGMVCVCVWGGSLGQKREGGRRARGCVGEGMFCGAVRSVGDGVSRHRRGVIVPTPFCLHTLPLLNGRIK